jgi:hypothetical protein
MHATYNPRVGMRVQLCRDVDIYPLNVYRAGLRGTVARVDEPTRFDVKLDQYFSELVDWENCLQVVPRGASDCNPDAFIPLPEGVMTFPVPRESPLPEGYDEYAPWHMGGGCMAWGRNLPSGGYVLICSENNDITSDPEAPVWLVGRFSEDGESWVSTEGGATLGEVLAWGNKMPEPDPENPQRIIAGPRGFDGEGCGPND